MREKKQKEGDRRGRGIGARSQEIKLACGWKGHAGFSLDEGGADERGGFFRGGGGKGG